MDLLVDREDIGVEVVRVGSTGVTVHGTCVSAWCIVRLISRMNTEEEVAVDVIPELDGNWEVGNRFFFSRATRWLTDCQVLQLNLQSWYVVGHNCGSNDGAVSATSYGMK